MPILRLPQQIEHAGIAMENRPQSHGCQIAMAQNCLAELLDAVIEVQAREIGLDFRVLRVVHFRLPSTGGFSEGVETVEGVEHVDSAVDLLFERLELSVGVGEGGTLCGFF